MTQNEGKTHQFQGDCERRPGFTTKSDGMCKKAVGTFRPLERGSVRTTAARITMARRGRLSVPITTSAGWDSRRWAISHAERSWRGEQFIHLELHQHGFQAATVRKSTVVGYHLLSDTYGEVSKDFPQKDAWLIGGNPVPILHLLVTVSTTFPEKTRYWESLSRIVGLTVGFRTAAAANPLWGGCPLSRLSRAAGRRHHGLTRGRRGLKSAFEMPIPYPLQLYCTRPFLQGL
jgi:hypothetical protein